MDVVAFSKLEEKLGPYLSSTEDNVIQIGNVP